MKVFVYKNSRKKCWSVMDWESRRVIDHTNYILLRNPVFRVSRAGRERVLREKRKNVHAGVLGELVSSFKLGVDLTDKEITEINGIKIKIKKEVFYNPYKHKHFLTKNFRYKEFTDDTKIVYWPADWAIFTDKVYAIWNQ